MLHLHLPSNVQQSLVKFVPSSVAVDITCFVFCDYHPRDDRKIDVTICTSMGEIKELYQRETISSIYIDSPATKIRRLRNSVGTLFYIAEADDCLFIISTGGTLQIHKRITNVDSYTIDDALCGGQAGLIVVCKDDGVPIIFDDDMNSLGDEAAIVCQFVQSDTLPIITDLMRKLTEAKFGVKSTEDALKKLLRLRQTIAFGTYTGISQGGECSLEDQMDEPIIKLNSDKPWVKVCNNKVIIVLEAINTREQPISYVNILLHHTAQNATNYTTKLFESMNTAPFWTEVGHLIHNTKTAIVAITDLNELKYSSTSKIKFQGVLSYKVKGKETLSSLEEVEISSLDTMGESFDILSNIGTPSSNKMLAVLATTKKVELLIRHLKNDVDPILNILEISIQYLNMESICDNVVAHTYSPYHALNGVTVVSANNGRFDGNYCLVSVYTRLQSQVLNLIHYIYEVVPYHLIITTPEYRITAKTAALAEFNEERIERN